LNLCVSDSVFSHSSICRHKVVSHYILPSICPNLAVTLQGVIDLFPECNLAKFAQDSFVKSLAESVGLERFCICPAVVNTFKSKDKADTRDVLSHRSMLCHDPPES